MNGVSSCRLQELQADSLPVQRLEELNRALDEYILRHSAHRGRYEYHRRQSSKLRLVRAKNSNLSDSEDYRGQMCFKSEIVAEIARLHENSAYSILGVSPDASDAEPRCTFNPPPASIQNVPSVTERKTKCCLRKSRRHIALSRCSVTQTKVRSGVWLSTVRPRTVTPHIRRHPTYD